MKNAEEKNTKEQEPGFLVAKGNFPQDDGTAEKQHVKSLASAMFMSLMNYGETKVRTIGRSASYNAIKACAIASGYCYSKEMDISWESVFEEGDIGELKQEGHVTNVTALMIKMKGHRKSLKQINDFSNRNDPGFLVAKGRFNGDKTEQSLLERKHVKGLSSAIFMSVSNHGYANVRAVGKSACYNALKAISISGSYFQADDRVPCWIPFFTEGNLGELQQESHVQNVTAIVFQVREYSDWKKEGEKHE